MAVLDDQLGSPLLDQLGNPLLDQLSGGTGPVVFAGAWSASSALPSGYAVPPPAARSLAVPVANTGLGGNWLIAFCSWRIPPGAQATVAVGDDAHNASPGANVWEPLGVPNGTSPLSGNVAASIWYCRGAFPAQNVYVSPDGAVTSMAVLVTEVSGLPPWQALAGVATGYEGESTSGSLSVPAPASQALMLAVLAGGNDTGSITGPGSGWTGLPAVTATDGTDHAADCVLVPAWQVTAAAAAPSWTSSAAQDLAGVVAGIILAPAAPAAPSQSWPYTQLLAGFGSGAGTPWDQVAFTDITPRFQSGTPQRGKQYELDTIQAGTMAMVLSNNDGALSVGNTGSPYFPGVQVYTPARLLATWPPPPAQNARTYSVWRGCIERWPQSLTPARYAISNTTGTDAYALLTPLMKTLAQAEVLADGPYAYWPCYDPDGANVAANLAKGNSQQLQVVQSKYGAGGATSDFGISLDFLAGDPGCTGWQQASVPAGGTQGWALYYQDTGLPSLSGGVTAEGWFSLATAQPSGLSLVLIDVRNSAGGMLQVRVLSTGQLVVDTWDRLTRALTTTTVVTQSMLTGIPGHVSVSFGQGSWTIYVNGGAIRSATGSCDLANTGYWVSFGGYADRTGAAGFCNVTAAHLAVFGYQLPQSRVISHYLSALNGMTGQDTSGPRVDRLLGDANCAYPRIMPAGPDLFTGALDIGGQAVSQNVVNVAGSDSSWLMTDSAGYLFLQARRQGYGLAAQWEFGELQASPLNANSLFNGTIAPWAGARGATAAYSTAWQYGPGEGSLLITPDGVTMQPGAAAELDAVTPGTSYAASAWTWSAAGWASGAFAAVTWYDSSSALITTAAGTPVAVPAATPLQVTFAARAPAGAAFAALAVFLAGTPSSSVTLNVAGAVLLPPGEYAYLGDIAADCDPSQTYNDVTLSQLSAPPPASTTLTAAAGSGAVTLDLASVSNVAAGSVLLLAAGTGAGELVTVSAVSGLAVSVNATGSAHGAGATAAVLNPQATGVTVTAASPASIAAFGDQTLQQTSYLTGPAAITDQAQWVVNAFGTPAVRISGMTLDPAANPVLWPVVLGLETGQAVQVTRRLQGTQPVIGGLFQVMSVGHSIGQRSWKTKVALVPYPGSVLTCDDPVLGAPGSPSLGW